MTEGNCGVPAAEGHIVVDTKKCQGCMVCMLACSLVHEGKLDLSRSRIQVLQDSFERFPQDIAVELAPTCDLCADVSFWDRTRGPHGMQACVLACPLGAIRFSAKMPTVSLDGVYE